jgi:xylose isomerase
MDAFARGLKIASAIRADGELSEFVQQRYRTWDTGVGAEIESGQASFTSLEQYMLEKGDISPNPSGRQEMLEHLINRYL